MPKTLAPTQNKTTQAAITIVSILFTAIAVLFLLGLCVVELWVVPKFIEIFMDFDTQLPWITIQLIKIPAAVYLAIYGLGIVGLIAKECIPQLPSGIKLAVNLIVFVLCLAMAAIYLVGLQLPMVQITESMM